MGQRTCDFEGCGRPHEAHGLCPGHYRQRTEGRPLTPLQIRRNTADRDHLGRKQCLVCMAWLPIDSFFTNRTPKDGLHNRCMRCHRAEKLLRNYGITLDQYEQTLQAQGGACKICGGTNENGNELSVDHDHTCCLGRKSCGRCVRGLLCNRCNMGLGYFRDDAMILETALGYLKAYGSTA